MSALPLKKHVYSLEEYAEFEKSSEERLEYFEGNVWSITGASPTHEELVANLITELKNNLRGRGCRVFGSNLRVKFRFISRIVIPMLRLCAASRFTKISTACRF